MFRFNFFVDGSMGEQDPGYRGIPGAYSLVYQHAEHGHFVEQAWFVDKAFTNTWTETMAIVEAMNMVTLHLRLEPAVEGGVIHIFTDSMASLGDLQGINNRRNNILSKMAMSPLLEYAAKLSKELKDRGVQLVLCHLPGHQHDVAGHGIADTAAYDCFVHGRRALEALRRRVKELMDGVVSPAASYAANAAAQAVIQAPTPGIPPGLRSRGNYLGSATRREPDHHKGIWPTLQGRSAKLIAAFKRNNPPTAEGRMSAQRLEHLLQLRRQGSATEEVLIEIKALKRMHHFL